jgi:hypothetical protein
VPLQRHKPGTAVCTLTNVTDEQGCCDHDWEPWGLQAFWGGTMGESGEAAPHRSWVRHCRRCDCHEFLSMAAGARPRDADPVTGYLIPPG